VRFPLRTIPVAAATDHNTWLVISAGSEVEIPVLFHEIDLLEQAGHPVRNRLMIDREATVIEQRHIDQEKQRALHENIGSTGKGIGAARADRMMRGAKVAREFPELWDYLGDTQSFLNRMHQADGDILIEGTQGYHLGMTAGHYPRSTTNNCRAIDCISQAGVTPLRLPDTWLVFRTYPIRVAGNSGPMGDEIDWEQLSDATDGYIQPERTTVTNKVRRVAEWNPAAARRAVDGNGGNRNQHLHLALMFVDYFDPTLAGATSLEQIEQSRAMPEIEAIEDDLGIGFTMFGTGPATVVWR
jgi:adenylosuccinate synthase